MKNIVLIFGFLLFNLNCEGQLKNSNSSSTEIIEIQEYNPVELKRNYTTFPEQLADKALELTKDEVVYDPAYYAIDYPNGDVPANKGVCTDVVIRAYRKMGIDLQKEVHIDMQGNFAKYPKRWGLRTTDKNIDHRRVPNLQTFFTRKGEKLTITDNAEDYKPGDLVTWILGGRLPHIGIVSNIRNSSDTHFMMVHNVGSGQVLDDCLFRYPIDGHYRYGK